MRRSAPLAVLLLLPIAAIAQQAPTVTAATDRSEAFRGEPITLQIVVDGADELDREPVPPGGRDFAAELRSAGPSNSQSITIVNGQRSEQTRRRYVLVYRLTATRTGNLILPPVQIKVGGKTLATAAIPISVREPVAIDEYRLLLELDRSRLWLGETATLTTWWLWRPDYGPSTLASFTHPVLGDGAVAIEHLPPDPSSDNRVRLTVAGQEVIALRTARSLGGEELMGLRFDTLLTPQHAGRTAIPAAVVVFDGVAGYRAGRHIFGRSVRRELTDRFVVPSNQLALSVEDVPTVGRPADYSGLTGTFRLRTMAGPPQVKVGDPIDLTITLIGRGNLHSFTLPELGDLPGFEAFRVGRRGGADAPAPIGSDERVFERTLRALHADVVELPAIELTVFDTDVGAYRVIRSEPIPLQVEDARQVTLADVEGAAAAPTQEQVSIRAATSGIAHNYEGQALTVDQRYDPLAVLRSPFGIVALSLAPLVFLVAGLGPIGGRLLTRVRGGPRAGGLGVSGRPRSALARLRRQLATTPDADAAGVHDALLRYVGDRLGGPVDARELSQLQRRMTEAAVPVALVDGLPELVDGLERARFGGGGTTRDDGALADRVVKWAEELDAALRSRRGNGGDSP